MPRHLTSKSVEWLALLAILLLAASLRIGQPEVVEYKRDEANLSQLALDLATGEDFPLLGIGSSVGFPNAPINVYILAIPYTLSTNPLHATQFIGLMNVAAIALTYLLARRYVSGWAALVVALLFAVSPWHIVFSRKIWAQNMLPLFVVLVLGSGVLGFLERKRWAQITHLPLLVITGQIHYGAFVLIPVTVYLLWQGRRRVFTRTFGLSVLIAFLLVLPYIIGLLQAGLASPEAIHTALTTGSSDGEDGAILTDAALRGAAIMLSGRDIHALAGPQQFENYLASVPDAYPLFDVLWWMIAAAAVWLVIRAVRHRDARTPVDITLLILFVSPILAYTATWTPFFIHYLIPMFPAAYIMVGFAVHDLLKHRLLVGMVLGVLALVGVLQVIFSWALLDFVRTTPTPDGFGTPLGDLLTVREAILADDPAQVIGSVGGQVLVFDEEASVWNTLLVDVPLVRFEDRNTWVYPADGAVLLTDDCETAARDFPTRDGCYGLGIRSNQPSGLTGIPAENRTFANGVRLIGYAWEDNCLDLLWHISIATPQDYQFAVNFYGADGQRIAQADALSWPGYYWRPGDQVVRRFCSSTEPQEVVGVGIGMYTFAGTSFNNVDVLDSAGNPAGQTVRWSLEP